MSERLERVVIVPKEFYADLAVLLRPLERIKCKPSEFAWETGQREQADPRFPEGLVLVAPAPDGPRYLYFMKGLDE